MRLSMIITDKNFASFFWTQFLGAFNDNFFKNALLVLVAYRGVTLLGMNESTIVALAGGVFILPFFLFSPLAGQICDKFQRSKVIRLTKVWEAIIMFIAGLGFYFQSYGMLLIVLFFMGLQSTFFGPAKYSIIPELVEKDDLTEGNAFIELGTFVSILLGTIAGGLATTIEGVDTVIGFGLVGVSIVGYLTSRGVRDVPIGDPDLKIDFNPIPQFVSLFKICSSQLAVWNSVLGISWFWFFGAGILSVLPIYCKNYLGVDQGVATLFLAMFTVGIGLGSIIAEKLSFKRVEIGIVPIGSLGMTLFLIDLFLVEPNWTPDVQNLMTLSQFVSHDQSWRLLIDFLLMSTFGGMFIVPLYTLVQERADHKYLSRIIAGNNILNALFMVISSLLVMLFYQLNLTTAEIFLAFAMMNVIAAIYIYTIVPEFTLRFYTWILSHILYRVEAKGLENIPTQGGVFLASNHVTYVDWLIIFSACPRPARFVMHYRFFEIPIVKWVLKQAKVIPIAGANEDRELMVKAFDQISNELKNEEVVIIFPEGMLTRDGQLNPFRPGIVKALEKDPVPVVPVTLKGFWGSSFSKHSKGFFPRQFRRPVTVTFHPPISPSEFELHKLEEVIAGDLGETPPHKRG
ncbi:MAG: MFS transporter [Bdellovibrionales bacterium]